ncbi:hypothetical protein A2U01_0099328, partial [Trifolium medium]|nr:hypothetical protein [Trifolium medium]
PDAAPAVLPAVVVAVVLLLLHVLHGHPEAAENGDDKGVANVGIWP